MIAAGPIKEPLQMHLGSQRERGREGEEAAKAEAEAYFFSAAPRMQMALEITPNERPNGQREEEQAK